MKVYYTKYALSDGAIQVIEGDLYSDTTNPDMTGYFYRSDVIYDKLVPPRDWYETWDEAVKRANALHAKAVVSAEKKLAKLKAMEWEKSE